MMPSIKRILFASMPLFAIMPSSSPLSFGANRKQCGGGTSSNRLRSENMNSYGRISTCSTGFRLFSSESNNDKDDDNNDSDNDENEKGKFATEYHAPVMVNECIDALLNCERGNGRIRNIKYDKKDNKEGEQEEQVSSSSTTSPLIFVDGTLGGGGHSAALLQTLKGGDIVFGCDIDPNALNEASKRLSYYTNHDGIDRPLFIPVQSNFGNLATKLPTIVHPITQKLILSKGVDGILLDLGVSSHQIDVPERGFSFMRDGPLDMRMGSASGTNNDDDDDDDASIGTDVGGLKAADICNEFDEKELQRIFSVYGDEPKSKTVAKAIVKNRPLYTTGELVDAIGSVIPQFAKNKRHGRTATCARVFQSLRIVVNNEDGVLSQVLSDVCPTLLIPGGRLVVMSYHSMEDRATKRIMRDGSLEKIRNGRQRINNDEKDIYGNYNGPSKPFKPISKRRKATEEETSRNPRARSAILRVAERLEDF
ncbi:MAG: 16S rRNA (cytosine1402-N4)-methyltransferase [Bacillariaceae sp.]|jgi:16S rRNA (cytosine1402-N4)-methyltransferase